ncbi:hypothetical protein MSP8886_01531 [Marinomonas spartinae]|uniref:DUF2254 domain-containing protein n=1 Tax=Marinomonas spartinae TaxID=1792290 RepID=A0A1A8TC21_9GAMM|nr:DUF2254 domain-containing protein [Marinomonas spartinae]SBS29388.1 hypothetical protein MSP8886_01531 [Marinomonas spartinae]
MTLFIKDTQLLKTYDTVKTSFWFTPCLILLLTISCCAVLLCIDFYSELHSVRWLHFLYHADADITRSLLTSIAGSIMTVVSITFSITIVALTTASSQFGPRLIRNFMEDTSTQLVLGTFIALFVYCLVLVRMTGHFANGDYLPGLTIAGAMLMTLFGILLLIYFIHHVSQNLQSDNVIDNVHLELQRTLEKIFDQQKEDENTESRHNQLTTESVKTDNQKEIINLADAIQIKSDQYGYIQTINYTCLCKLMKKLDGYIEIVVKQGDFVVKRMVTMKCYLPYLSKEDEQALLQCFTFGAKRTPIQDPEFAIHQLVEIALRALSPGINDPYSAIACVDKLTATLCDMTQKTFPKGYACDEDNLERVCYKVTSFHNLASIAFDQIRQHSQTCLAISLRQLEGLIHIAEQATDSSHWSFIDHQKRMIEHSLKQRPLIDLDRREITNRLQHLDKLLTA